MGENGWISVNDIAKYLHPHLIKRGYVPTSDETLDLADIVFQCLVELEVIEVESNE